MGDIMIKAQHAYNALSFETALDFYKQEISERPQDALAHDGAARCYYKLGKPLEAIQEFDRALVLDPSFTLAHVGAAQAYHQIRETPKSREHIRSAYELAPMNKDVLTAYGNLLLLDNKIDEALEMLKRAIQVDPDSYLAYRNLAVVYYRQGDRKEMFFCAKQIRRLNPSFKNHVRLAVAYMNYARLINVFFVSLFVLAITSEILRLWTSFFFAIAFFALWVFIMRYLRN